jgi:hypothetical protein
MTNFLTCDICGKPGVPTNTILFKSDNDVWLLAHQTCYDQYVGKCTTCNTTECALEKDHSVPQYTMKVEQRGPMRIQTQVLNPILIDRHCKNGCLCWDGNNCARQTSQSCQNYKLIASEHQ